MDSLARQRTSAWLRSFVPTRVRYSWLDLARGGAGAFAGIVVASVLVRTIGGGPIGLPFIVAPIGASAVLVFAAPASPLAHPWAVFGGNTASAAVGIAAAKVFDDRMTAAAVAVGAAIIVMMLLGCLHPPGGACALFAAVGAPAVRQEGFAFALWPVAANTAALLLIAMAVNNFTGRSYPHVAPVPTGGPSATDKPPTQRLGVQTADVEAAMKRLDQGLDINPEDVVGLVRDAEQHALDRRLGRLEVGSIMARDVQVVHEADSLYRARMLMNQHHVKARRHHPADDRPGLPPHSRRGRRRPTCRHRDPERARGGAAQSPARRLGPTGSSSRRSRLGAIWRPSMTSAGCSPTTTASPS